MLFAGMACTSVAIGQDDKKTEKKETRAKVKAVKQEKKENKGKTARAEHKQTRAELKENKAEKKTIKDK